MKQTRGRSSGGSGGGTTAGPGGSLALTGNNSTGALIGLESLLLGGALWALGGRGRRRNLGRTRRRRNSALYVTLPTKRNDSV